MRKQLQLLLLLVGFISYSTISNGQLADGSIAPDFTLTDINGNSHNLYSILDEGKNVVLDFSATWCGPCWSYHNGGQLEALYDERGPGGANDVEIFYIEADGSTNLNCLFGSSGCNSSTYGDWTNVPYPICSPVGSELSVTSAYSIGYYPTIYLINAIDKRVWETGQTSSSSFQNIIDNSFPMATTFEAEDQSCVDFGSIDLTTTSGSGFIGYQWSDGSTSEDLTNASGGQYSVTVTDGSGYFINVGPIFIDTEDYNPNMIITPNVDQAVSCAEGWDGIVSLSTTGGWSNDYTYEWSDGNNQATVLGLSSGFYEVTVTDILGCTNTTFFELEEPTPMTLSNDVVGTCEGTNNGSLGVNVNAGVFPYAYTIGASFVTTNTFENLSPGTYELTVYDGNSCSVEEVVVIPQLQAPNAEFSASADEINCDNPFITLEAFETGSTINHEWLLDGALVGTESILEATTAGDYMHRSTNTSSTCGAEAFISISSTGGIPIISTNSGQINCTTQAIELCATTDIDNDVSWLIDGQVVNSTCVTVSNAGDYTATALAPNGCESSTTSTVDMDVTSAMISNITAGTLDCDSGSATINAMVDDNADNIIWKDENGNVININNETSVEVFTAGTYTIEAINNGSGCSTTSQVVVVENTLIPMINAVDFEELTCDQATTSLTVDVDLPMGDYTLVWTDATGAVVGTTNTIEVSDAGVYAVAVQSTINSCIGNAEANVLLNTATVDYIDTALSPITCTNQVGSIALNIANDAAEYSVKWLDVDSEEVGTDSTLDTDIPGTYTAIVTLLATGCQQEIQQELIEIIDLPLAGIQQEVTAESLNLEAAQSNNSTYSWLVDGVEVSTDITLDIDLDETQLYVICLVVTNDCGSDEECTEYQHIAAMNAFVTKVDNLCNDAIDGSISIDVQGGLPQFTIEVTGPNGFSSDQSELTDLADGVYSYNVIDAVDTQITGTVVINSPDAIVATNQSENASSSSAMDGSIILDVSGGVEPYTYLWSNGSTTKDQEALIAEVYSCIITDANGCMIETGDIMVQFTSGVSTVFDLGISIYPNPVLEVLNINMSTTESFQMRITDISGKLIRTDNKLSTGRLDVSELKSGIYFIQFKNSDKSAVHRMVKL